MFHLDREFSFLEEVGGSNLLIGITADHGMSDKTKHGKPDIVFMESLMKKCGFDGKVVLPITDPYVRHHSSLGGFASIYLKPEEDRAKVCQFLKLYGANRGFKVWAKGAASEAFGLPSDRIGDLVVVSDSSVVFGKSEEFHDLTLVSFFTKPWRRRR